MARACNSIKEVSSCSSRYTDTCPELRLARLLVCSSLRAMHLMLLEVTIMPLWTWTASVLRALVSPSHQASTMYCIIQTTVEQNCVLATRLYRGKQLGQVLSTGQ